MRIQDLMIGDIVSINGWPARVVSISADIKEEFDDEVLLLINEGKFVEYEKYYASSLEPIPITTEILEKNGWKDVSDHTLKGCETFRLHLEQRSFNYTLTLKMRDYFRLDSYDDRVYTLCEVNFGFKYVHELQHALRLCGIDKEITM